MLAHKTKALTLAMTFVVALTSMVAGQQPQQPSQRYQPVPPSVHVPPHDIQRVGSHPERNRSDLQNFPMRRRPATSKAAYALSGQIPQRPQFERGTVTQISYVADESPQVPEVLSGTGQRPTDTATTSPTERLARRPASPADLRNVPASASATQMVQAMQRRTPRVDPQAITSHQEQMDQQLQQVRDRAARDAEQRKLTASQTMIQSAQHQTEQAQHSEAEYQKMEESFIEEVMSATVELVSAPVQQDDQTNSTAPMLSAEPVHVASNELAIEQPSNQIRQVSSETFDAQQEPITNLANQSMPEISLAAPGIQVQTFGPRSIGINKTSTFTVVVTNQGMTEAVGILIGIDLPSWVDIANTNLTNGQKEITDGVEQARLLWTVDRIAANSTQTITIETVARKAEMFDLGVEWTLAPRVGTTRVEVTEPRLEMKIAGPRDVLYGEKAIYHVTVRNPGTGAAENVSVMLPEALGGERASLGDIPAGREKNFQVELLARTAGQLELTATAVAAGDLTTSATRQIDVRRANLSIMIDGPPMKYAGSVGEYSIVISNTGDATAQEIIAAIALPAGAKYLGGVDAASEIDGGLRWPVGSLDAGQQKTFKINCELNAAGELQVEAGARGQGDLAASAACVTSVETVADLVLSVEDPKGPLPTGQDVVYQIRVKNRGTRAAENVQLVMQFSEGIEPVAAHGLKHRIVPGQVLFSPIKRIGPGEEMTFEVIGKAYKPDTHIFRAQLTCADSDAREIAEGTTRFFGDVIEAPANDSTDVNTADADNEISTESNEFKR